MKEQEMDWNRLHFNNCPNCDKKLQFRLARSKNSIRSRRGADTVEDMYFCFKCDFQITGSKLMSIKKPKEMSPEDIQKIPKVFRTGYLSY
jgi:ABC-type transporter MlaC component